MVMVRSMKRSNSQVVQCVILSVLLILALKSSKVTGDLVDGLNVVDKKLREGLLSRTSRMSIPVRDRNKPINVTLGMELKKIVDMFESPDLSKIEIMTFLSRALLFEENRPAESNVEHQLKNNDLSIAFYSRQMLRKIASASANHIVPRIITLEPFLIGSNHPRHASDWMPRRKTQPDWSLENNQLHDIIARDQAVNIKEKSVSHRNVDYFVRKACDRCQA